ncbi:acyl-CoA dehydrogenase family protein [Actinoplanes sp. NPDC049265]|uniref:acyl-CoA dehydrogenase family protein n=1 Tax=Actinoplanes sp. NPDC049265 TaxID=3363902 RepID=UPI0037167CE2
MLDDRLEHAIEKYRDEADRAGWLPPELVSELRSAGAFSFYTPREFGGREASLAGYHDILRRLGRAGGSVAWTVWNLNMGLVAAFLPPADAATLFAAGRHPLIAHNGAPGRAEPVPGGYRISGTWKLVSGAHTADWFLLGAIVDDGPLIFGLVPRDDVTVQETWDAVAMRGSDSNTVVVTGAEVPSGRTFDLSSPSRVAGSLYRLPIVTLFAAGPAAVLIGMAESAVDEAARLVRERIGADGAPLVTQPRVQAAVGRAGTQVDAARSLLLTTAAELDRTVAGGEAVTDAQRGRYRGAICHIAEIAREVLVSMYDLGGSAPLLAGNRLGQIVRDGLAAAQHMNVAPWQFEVAGRTRLGLPAGTPLL